MTRITTDEEAGQKQPLLLVHGFPLSSRMFIPQFVIAGARTLAADLPGFGSAEPFAKSEVSIDDFAAFLLNKIDAAKIEKVTIAGVSMGGYICLALLRLVPERINGIILIDTRENADSSDTREMRHKQIARVQEEGTEFLIEEMLPKLFHATATEKGRALLEQTRSEMRRATVKGVVDALGAMAGRPDSSPILRNLNIPALLLTGEHDPVTPPGDAVRMQQLIGNSAILQIVSQAGHLSNLEQPELVNAAIQNFLTRISHRPSL